MQFFPATSQTVLERPPSALRPRAVERGLDDRPGVVPATAPPPAPPEVPLQLTAHDRAAVQGTALHAWPAQVLAGPGRVLVVDDEDGVLKVVSQVLRNAGYQVCGCPDGIAAWEMFCTHHFDLVVTDHTMPQLTGLELLRRVRAAFSCVPCVLMSGNLPLEDPELARLLTPGSVLNKPFSMTTLVTVVGSLLVPPPGELEREAAPGPRLPFGNPFPAEVPPA